MLPDFDEEGDLPRGIHRCTIEEVASRFGQGSPEREAGASELVEFVEWARGAGIRRLIVDGSFVTSKQAPNDVDVAILPGEDQPHQGEVALDSRDRWPLLHVQVAMDEADLERWALEDFGFDRKYKPRGVLEVEL